MQVCIIRARARTEGLAWWSTLPNHHLSPDHPWL